MPIPTRDRIQAVGKINLVGSALLVDTVRIVTTFPFAIIAPPVAWLIGSLEGIMAAICYMFAYNLIFKVHFTERLATKAAIWMFGSGLPFGTTLSTVVNIAVVGFDDKRYNIKATKYNEEEARTLGLALSQSAQRERSDVQRDTPHA